MSMASAYFTIGNMDGKRGAQRLKRGLDTLPGVQSVSVGAGSGRIAVDFDDTGVKSENIAQHIGDMGFRILGSRTDYR